MSSFRSSSNYDSPRNINEHGTYGNNGWSQSAARSTNEYDQGRHLGGYRDNGGNYHRGAGGNSNYHRGAGGNNYGRGASGSYRGGRSFAAGGSGNTNSNPRSNSERPGNGYVVTEGPRFGHGNGDGRRGGGVSHRGTTRGGRGESRGSVQRVGGHIDYNDPETRGNGGGRYGDGVRYPRGTGPGTSRGTARGTRAGTDHGDAAVRGGGSSDRGQEARRGRDNVRAGESADRSTRVNRGQNLIERSVEQEDDRMLRAFTIAGLPRWNEGTDADKHRQDVYAVVDILDYLEISYKICGSDVARVHDRIIVVLDTIDGRNLLLRRAHFLRRNQNTRDLVVAQYID